MAKKSPAISSPPKPPKLSLPILSPPKPRSLKPAKPPARPYQPKPAKLAAPKRNVSTRPRVAFPKPHTSDSLRVIPQSVLTNAKSLSSRMSSGAGAGSAPKHVAPAKASAPKATPVKTVLWISSYPALRETTKLMIEAEGFEFHSASDFLQVEAACQTDRFQLAVVDPTLAPKIKRAIGAVIREKRPSTLILELCQVSSEIPNADYVLIGHDPHELMRMVKRIARERSV